MAHYDEQRERYLNNGVNKKREPYTIKTSDGLREFLIRNGIEPTGDSVKDIKLARPLMFDSYTRPTGRTT